MQAQVIAELDRLRACVESKQMFLRDALERAFHFGAEIERRNRTGSQPPPASTGCA